ncbi:MAG: hypothetical protein J6T31_06475 [Methanobrevibacter sp.]|nr:hypothetical protein [Methanobrevibacter sp.]
MKIISHFHGVYQNNFIVLKLVDENDRYIVEKLFRNKKEREGRTKQEVLLRCEINAPYQHRTFKQNNAVWILISIIFQSMEGRNGTHEELYELYCDLLEEYADKKPSRLNGKLRSIHISGMNTEQAGRFIDSLLFHLATLCELSIDLQSDVRKFIYEWEEWKHKEENEFEEFASVEEMRQKVVYSEASGKGGVLHFHHIVTRGACPAAVDKTWNLMALTPDEHNFYHQQCKTWDEFLEVYPHLRGKVERAQKRCAELVQQNNSIGNLAAMALAAQGE